MVFLVLSWLSSGLNWFSIGFTFGLARLYCSRLQCFLSLAHSGEGGGSSPEMPQTLRSSKKLQNECFSKLFVRVSGCGSACVSSPRRSGAPKSFKTIAFSMLFAWVFGCESWGCSGALISVFSFHARNEEDNDSVWIALGVSFSGYLSFHARNEEDNDNVWIALGVSFSGDFFFHARNDEDVIVSRVESGQWTVCSRRSGAPKTSK